MSVVKDFAVQMSVIQLSVGQMSVDQMSVGQMSVGQMSVGQMSVCQTVFKYNISHKTFDQIWKSLKLSKP